MPTNSSSQSKLPQPIRNNPLRNPSIVRPSPLGRPNHLTLSPACNQPSPLGRSTPLTSSLTVNRSTTSPAANPSQTPKSSQLSKPSAGRPSMGRSICCQWTNHQLTRRHAAGEPENTKSSKCHSSTEASTSTISTGTAVQKN